MHGIPHSDDKKAAALAALLAGQSVSAVARTYKLGRTTVAAWRDAAGIGQGASPVRQEKREEIGDLVATFLRETLRTVSVLAVQFRDPAWLREQNAADAAVLFGVLTDKGIRILEAIDANNGDAEPKS